MNKFEKFSGKSELDKEMLTKILGGTRVLTGFYESAMASGIGGKMRPMTMGPN